MKKTIFIYTFFIILFSCSKSSINSSSKSTAKDLCNCIEKIDDSQNATVLEQEMKKCFQFFREQNMDAKDFENIMANIYPSCPSFFELSSKIENSMLNLDLSQIKLNNSDCSILRKGKFKFIHPRPSVDYFLYNKNKMSYYPDDKNHIHYDIEWISDCKYKATVLENTSKAPKLPPFKGDILTTEMIGTKNDTIVMKSTYNKYKAEIIFQIVKIE